MHRAYVFHSISVDSCAQPSRQYPNKPQDTFITQKVSSCRFPDKPHPGKQLLF